MAERSESQRIGSGGQRLVEGLIEQTKVWISRRQDEDFGIDLEAELAEPKVQGEILKIQIKSTENVELSAQGVKVVLEKRYLRMAASFRMPLVLVVADVAGGRAWYLWLQGWLVEQRRVGRTLESLKEHVTLYIPESETLTSGLEGPLKEVACWRHENQMVLSLVDTIRTAAVTRNENVLMSLVELIGNVDAAYKDFPLEILIQAVVDLSAEPRFMWEMSMLARFLAIVGKKCGGKISKDNVLRMVVPGEGWSRAGLVGLGALYDSHEDHIRSMNLPAAFDELGHDDIGYYCRLREKHRGVKSLDLAFGDYDYAIRDFTLDIPDKGDFLNRYANRGESAYIDHLRLNRQASEDSPE